MTKPGGKGPPRKRPSQSPFTKSFYKVPSQTRFTNSRFAYRRKNGWFRGNETLEKTVNLSINDTWIKRLSSQTSIPWLITRYLLGRASVIDLGHNSHIYVTISYMWLCNDMAMYILYDYVTMWLCDYVTMWLYDYMTMWLCDYVTM